MGGEQKLSTREELIKALHQATVELITHKNAARPLTDACATIFPDDGTFSVIQQTTISLTKDGQNVTLHYPPTVSQAQEAILGDVQVDIASPDNAGEVVVEDTKEEYQQDVDTLVQQDPQSFSRVESFAVYPPPSDESFLSLPLKDLDLRFAVSYTISNPHLVTIPSNLLSFPSVRKTSPTPNRPPPSRSNAHTIHHPRLSPRLPTRHCKPETDKSRRYPKS